MGLDLLPDELQLSLAQRWPCREAQIRSLTAFLNPSRPSPSTIVLYGPQATGKSGLLDDYLAASQRTNAVVRCGEHVTGRQLLETTIGAVREALVLEDETRHDDSRQDGGRELEGGPRFGPAVRSCENLGTLLVQLQSLLEKRRTGHVKKGKFVLVFDGVDMMREAPATLIPAIGRFGEFIPDLTTIVILQHPDPRFLHKAGVPQIHFPAYTRDQSLHILSQTPLDIFPPSHPTIANNSSNNKASQDYDEEVHAEDKAWLWPRFCGAVWDSLGQGAARDLLAFKGVCERLWRPFLVPVLKGDFGTRDFSRLMVAQRRLFQDEAVLLNSLMAEPSWSLAQTEDIGRSGVTASSYYASAASGAATPAAAGLPAVTISRNTRGSEMPYYTRWLLIAAYLASYNPARTDTTFFMKNSERKSRKRRGGGAAGASRAGGTVKFKTPRHLLPPSTFTLDRLLAILHAILPHRFRTSVDFYNQISALSNLRLLVKTGGGLGGGDPLEPAAKWKVGPAVSWDYVSGLARDLDFALRDHAAE